MCRWAIWSPEISGERINQAHLLEEDSTATVTVEIDGDYLASFTNRGEILTDGRRVTGMLYK